MLEQLGSLAAEGGSIDSSIHVLGAGVSVVLFIVSLRAYMAGRRGRFLYVCLAFLIFSVKEMTVLLDVLVMRSGDLTFLSHILTLAVVLLFFVGVVKK